MDNLLQSTVLSTPMHLAVNKSDSLGHAKVNVHCHKVFRIVPFKGKIVVILKAIITFPKETDLSIH